MDGYKLTMTKGEIQKGVSDRLNWPLSLGLKS